MYFKFIIQFCTLWTDTISCLNRKAMKLLIRQNIQQIMTKLDIISLQLQVTFSEHKQALNIVASNHKICRDILIITVREKSASAAREIQRDLFFMHIHKHMVLTTISTPNSSNSTPTNISKSLKQNKWNRKWNIHQ